MITISSSDIEVVVDPVAGASIVRLARPHGPNLLAEYSWETPSPASRGTSFGDSEADWLSCCRGGWQELFPNAGAACTVAGVPLPFHGEVSRSEWAVVVADSDQVTLRCPARLPLVLERTMTVQGATLRLEEKVSTEADGEWPFIWGHHPAFAATSATVIDMPPADVVADDGWEAPLVDLAAGGRGRWPHVPGRGGGLVDLSVFPQHPVERLCFVPRIPQAWAAIRGLGGDDGVALAWDIDAFPNLWLWWQFGGRAFPWYGRARLVAVEPQSNWPTDGLASAIARGDAHFIAENETATAWLEATVFQGDERPVTHVAQGGLLAF
jgi:hypothetical protein